MFSLGPPSRDPRARLAARVLILALIVGTLPIPAEASFSFTPGRAPVGAVDTPSFVTKDDNGNLISKSAEATYFWDFENRLVKAVKADGTVVEHLYDPDGNRVQTKTTPAGRATTVLNYLVDTSGSLSHVVAETDGANNLIGYYLRADDLLAVMRPDGGGGFISRFYHSDGLGSIRRLTDEAGNITDGYTYSAFGELLAHTGSDPQPYTFAGEPYNPNIGFYYNRARWLDPRVGRFTGMDPFRGVEHDPASLHRYLYAADDPINKVDPSGRFTAVEAVTVAAVIGALVAAAAYTYTHPPGRGTDGRAFTWRGLITWTVSGAAAGALVGLGGWYAALAWGPTVTVTIGGSTYPVARALVERWPSARVLVEHFIKHGHEFTNVTRSVVYTAETYAADAVFTVEFAAFRAYNAALGATYYARYFATSPKGNSFLALAIEKGGRIVSYRPLPIHEAEQFFPGIFR
jgi:RHS repeat-associated protein